VLRAIAEPRRREILRVIWTVELPAGEIAARFAVTRPAVSQHLKVLKDAGLVSARRSGTRRLYRACPDRVAEVRAFLEHWWHTAPTAPAVPVDTPPRMDAPAEIVGAETNRRRWRRLRLRPEQPAP
jgi:DNA-binding transcriptional ArsR family regulator